VSNAYLMIVKQGDSEYIEHLNVLVFKNRNREVLPVVKGGKYNFVEATPNNAKLLLNTGHSFIRGTLNFYGERISFVKEPTKQLQLLVGDFPEVDLEKLGIPNGISLFVERTEEFVDRVSQYLQSKLSSRELRLGVYTNNTTANGNIDFEVYQISVGESSKVNLIHNQFGLCKFSLERNLDRNVMEVKLSSIYPVHQLKSSLIGTNVR